MKRVAAGLAVIASIALAWSAIGASPFKQATGGIALSGPSQYVAFSAFDYGATGDRGTVRYTNFEYPATGTGVWNVVGTYPLTFVAGATYPHVVTIDAIKPLSTTATKFTGTGHYVPDPAYTWTVAGSVHGSTIEFVIEYTGVGAGYTVTANGTIAADGSMSGTAVDSNLLALSWSTPAASANEVLTYEAAISCAVVDDGAGTATFVFRIPAGFPGLSGLDVVAKVVDGGTPGTNGDTWRHGVASSDCEGPTAPYDIVAGNLVVH